MYDYHIMFSISFTGDLFTIFIRDNIIFKIILWSFYVFNDKTMFLNQFLAVLDGVHNTRTATPIVQLQSSKSAWFIRIKSHGLDLGKADFKNFLWFIPSLFVKGRYIEAQTVQKPDALTFINTPWYGQKTCNFKRLQIFRGHFLRIFVKKFYAFSKTFFYFDEP